MKKNKVGGILIIVILISFICGSIGGYLIFSNTSSNDDNAIKLVHSSVVLTESDIQQAVEEELSC